MMLWYHSRHGNWYLSLKLNNIDYSDDKTICCLGNHWLIYNSTCFYQLRIMEWQ